jgi:uncharacterized protein (DUF1697 family)
MSRTPTRPAGAAFVALLRGINVGGNNMIRMSALRESFVRLGFGDVSTYINSGNILFRSRVDDARKLEKTIEKMLVGEYALPSKVVIRSAADIARLVRQLPKDWGDTQWRYNVIFLRHTIDTKDIVAALNWKREFEKVIYVPGTLLWSARAEDVNKTLMLKLSSQQIYQEMTVRNLNTTRKLHELLQRMITPADR